MRWAIVACAMLMGGTVYALWAAHQARDQRDTAHAVREQAYAEAIRANDRFLNGVLPTPAEQAATACEARARMAAAVHRADPAQVREACLFTWRTTGALPRL